MEEKNSLKTVTHITKITYTIFVLKYYNYINQNVNSLLNMRINLACGKCVPEGKGFLDISFLHFGSTQGKKTSLKLNIIVML